MKSVLISIQPKWCALIANGRKTIEVRKTAPNIKPPFKCYIYCTKGNLNDPHQRLETHAPDGKIYLDNGNVMGEFVCDFIETISKNNRQTMSTLSCVPLPQLYEYAGAKGLEGLKGWHISSLLIYDKPKTLKDFRYTNEHITKIMNSVTHWECGIDDEIAAQIRRPPQSWCYVENK